MALVEEVYLLSMNATLIRKIQISISNSNRYSISTNYIDPCRVNWFV